MRSPKNMQVIQIQITNACPNNCSNCTRFCGWHQKPFFMDFQTFKKAIDSLEGFEGMIGIMGGEPTLHPQFKKFVNYFKMHVKEQQRLDPLIIPEDDYSYYRDVYWSNIKRSRGLWSSCGKNYYQNFELINDVFGYQCLNDHTNSGQHQALLVTRKQLRITDEEFYDLRDKCWIQNMWSASITPKGCFFCQVAAALDMLLDGPGGLPIQKGWWLRRPKDFGEQLSWCQKCSACLKVPSKNGNEQIDIISPEYYELLKDRKSFKAKNKRYQIFTKHDYQKYDGKINECQRTPYMKRGQKRINKNNNLKPQKINVCYNCENIEKYNWLEEISGNECLTKKFEDWCLLVFNNSKDITKQFFDRIYNPGIIYVNPNYVFFNKKAEILKDIDWIDIEKLVEQATLCNKICYFGTFKDEIENIKFSFLVPTYNSSKTIDKAIQGILNQDYSNFNVYFVDDGSTDNTVQIIQKYMQKDKRIQCVTKNQKNSSAVYSRMRLIDFADGEYSIWVDADDQINTNFCSMANWLLNIQKFDIIDFPFKVNSTGQIKNYGFRDQGNCQYYGKDVFDFYIMKKRNPYNLWSKVIKTDVLKKSKIPLIRIDLVDDIPLSARIYYNAQSYSSVNCERMYTYNFGNGRWGGKKQMSFQKYRGNCYGVKNAYELNYKFIIQNCPKKEYLQRIKTYSCIQGMMNNIQYLKPQDRLKGYNLWQELFKDSQI